jgi:hypothetical protein
MRAAALALLAVGLAAVPAAAATGGGVRAPKGMPSATFAQPADATFLYVYGRVTTSGASGASVALTQAKPALAAADFHSLAELAVESADGRQIVEVGWIVAPEVNGDSKPHIFVFHWIDGVPTCYNGCGYVSVTAPTGAGDPVTVGVTGKFGIKHGSHRWWISYGGVHIGYYPDSEWSGRFTSTALVQAFGEVAAAGPTPCTDMGNGVFGSAAGSARISKLALSGQPTPAVLVNDTAPSLYDFGGVKAHAFRFGGPGAC